MSKDLSDKEPYGLQILGYPIVVWRHKGKVVCVEDICPHRSAPLSVGRMVNGVLECKYHGWQFGANGECTFIPSAPHKDPPKSSHCKEFPSLEKYGTVWIYIGDELSEEERLKKFPDFLFVHRNSSTLVETSVYRDLDIDHGLMIENLLDPAHLPFTHEGTLAKRSDAQRMDMDVIWNTLTRNIEKEDDEDFVGSQTIGQRGFKVLAYTPNDPNKNIGNFTFFSPYIMKLDVTMKKSGRRMVQLQFCVPVTPTRMRLIVYFYQNIIPFSRYMPFMNRIMAVQSDKIINQDLELLAGQQVRLLQGARPWNTAVSADTGGVIYRKWRERAERSKPWFGGYSASGYLQMANELKEGKVIIS